MKFESSQRSQIQDFMKSRFVKLSKSLMMLMYHQAFLFYWSDGVSLRY